MPQTIPKSRFKARALEIFREIERTGKPVVITHRGVPVLTLTPYREETSAALTLLRKSVLRYTAPTRPVGADAWGLRSG